MVPKHSKQGRPIRRLITLVGTAVAATALVFAGASAANADTPPTATITSLTASVDLAHDEVQINGTADVQNAPAGSTVSVVFTVTGPGSPSAPASPVSGGSFGSSFSATPTTSVQDFTIVAQVTIDGQNIGDSASTTATVPIEQVGGGDGSDPGTWQASTLTAVAKCFDPKSGTGEIDYTITQPSGQTWDYVISLDGTTVGAGTWGPGATTYALGGALSHTKVSAGWHTIAASSQGNILMSYSVEVKACAATSGGSTSGGSSISTITDPKTSPLTGSAAPQTGARGDTASSLNAALGLGLGERRSWGSLL